MVTVAEYMDHARVELLNSRCEMGDVHLHCRQLMELALNYTAEKLIIHQSSPLSAAQKLACDVILEQRIQGVPLQYLAGTTTFWNDEFLTGPGVLIPRRETEHLVETLLCEETREEVHIAELGPGSGNIGISVLKERKGWRWTAFEKDPTAATYTAKNHARLLGASAAYQLVLGDFFEKAPHEAPYDWIVSNPPYLKHGEIPKLSREVQSEPIMALDGGPSGLEIPLALAQVATGLLKPRGSLLMEMDPSQESALIDALQSQGWSFVRVIPDYSGASRIILAHR